MKPARGKGAEKESPKTETELKKEVFAHVEKKDCQGPSPEEQNRILLDKIFITCTGKDILDQLEAMVCTACLILCTLYTTL